MTTPIKSAAVEVPRGPLRIIRLGATFILVDVITQFVLAIRPWDTVSPGWRLTVVQLAVAQLLPVGMVVLLYGVAARSSPDGSLRGTRFACAGLAAACLVAFAYLVTTGSQFVLAAQPEFYARLRVGLAQAVTGSVMGLAGFGLSAILLWRLVPERKSAPQA